MTTEKPGEVWFRGKGTGGDRRAAGYLNQGEVLARGWTLALIK